MFKVRKLETLNPETKKMPTSPRRRHYLTNQNQNNK